MGITIIVTWYDEEIHGYLALGFDPSLAFFYTLDPFCFLAMASRSKQWRLHATHGGIDFGFRWIGYYAG